MVWCLFMVHVIIFYAYLYRWWEPVSPASSHSVDGKPVRDEDTPTGVLWHCTGPRTDRRYTIVFTFSVAWLKPDFLSFDWFFISKSEWCSCDFLSSVKSYIFICKFPVKVLFFFFYRFIMCRYSLTLLCRSGWDPEKYFHIGMVRNNHLSIMGRQNISFKTNVYLQASFYHFN